MSLVTLDNGEQLAPAVYRAYMALRALAISVGLTLWVNSGYRTHAAQRAIFFARYVTAGNVNGRKVYDTRWYEGKLWYRVSNQGTVAVPGTSLHEKASAVDFGGSAVGTWLRAKAPAYGLSPTGYGFGESWHYDFTGDPWGGSPAGGGGEDMGAAEMAKLENIEALLAGTGPSLKDPNWRAGQGSVLQHLQNLTGFVWSGGTSVADPKFFGAPGTLYALAKTPVSRSVGGVTQAIPQIQDNADTNSMVRQLLARPAGSFTDAQVQVIADTTAKAVVAALPKGEVTEAGIAKAVRELFKTDPLK